MSDRVRRWLASIEARDGEPVSDPGEEAFVAQLRNDDFGWLDDYVAEKQGIEGGGDEVRRQYYRGQRKR